MRTGFGVKAAMPSAHASFLEEAACDVWFPTASVHQIPQAQRNRAARSQAHERLIRATIAPVHTPWNVPGSCRSMELEVIGSRP
jgi:hypothetical protein